MKYFVRAAVAVAALGSVLFVAAPTQAATATVMDFSGTLYQGSNFNYGNWVGLNGSGPCADAATTPSGGGRVCALATSGNGKGTCASWTATVSGNLTTQASVAAAPNYSVNLKLSGGDGVLTITGTAGSKQVTGRATYARQDLGCNTTGGNAFTVTGSLVITG